MKFVNYFISGIFLW